MITVRNNARLTTLATLFITTSLFVFFFLPDPAVAQKNAAIEQKINSLLARMTLAEKLGQLQQLDGDYPTGQARPEQMEMARKGLLGSTLNVRGAENVNAFQRAALQSRLKIPM